MRLVPLIVLLTAKQILMGCSRKRKTLDIFPKSCYLDLNAWNRNSTYVGPSERSRVVRGFGDLDMEPVWEQQKRKLRIQKLLPEVTVIREM